MNEPQKESAVLEAILIADGLLTLAGRMSKWLAERREVGEMTPEEESAHDAYLERKFAEWSGR